MLEELGGGPKSTDGQDQTDGKRKASDSVDGQKPAKRQKPVGVGFKPMAQRVAAKWKALDEETLAIYDRLAKEDLQRYKNEMKVYRDKNKNAAKTGEAPQPGLDASLETKQSNPEG